MIKNKKGVELTFSTIVIVILAVLVLIGIVYFVVNGFDIFKSSTKPFTDIAGSSAIKSACQLACDNEDLIGWCQAEQTLKGFNQDEPFTCDSLTNEIDACEAITCP